MRKKSYAKLTLFLDAYRDESDILMFQNIIVPIDLFDMVYLEKNDEMILETNRHYLRNNRKNTVYKSIMIMKDRFNIQDNFSVKIVKNIPAQAGLGGGSANAASVILMLNEMYQLNLSREELIDVAKEIDEDTPYCLFNTPALVENTGEKITPIQTSMELYYVLVKPKFGTSTQSFLQRFKPRSKKQHKVEEVIHALEEKKYRQLTHNTYNVFEKLVSFRNPELRKIKHRLKELGLDGIVMSGSGTSVYGLTQSKEKAIEVYESIALDYNFVKYGKIKTEEKS